MKKMKVAAVLMAVACFVGIWFVGAQALRADVQEKDTVDKGVFIGGLDVGELSAEEATAAVNAYVDGLLETKITLVGPKNSIELTLKDMGLTANVEGAVAKATGTAKAGNLITRFMLLKDLEKENVVIDLGLKIDKQKTAELIHAQLSKLEIPAKNWDLKRESGKFTIIEGKDGTAVDIVSSVKEISADISKNWQYKKLEEVANTSYDLKTQVAPAKGSQEELSKVKDLMGSFTTNFSSSTANRATNLQNGCSKINGTLLYPGETFSAYAKTSPYTIANGYREAGAYEAGNTVQSVGGGICQVSTTLYNAAIRAELKIVQRNAHSMTVSYVEVSEDAAIAGTYKDLKFRNDYDYPIYIEGYCKNRNITFNIYGCETREENRTISFESEIISTNDPETEYTLSSSTALGTYKVTRSKHVGYKARLWKIIMVNGVETDRVRMNQSNYQASCKKVTIGTKGATADQLAKIKAALATKDDAYIKSVVTSMKNATTTPPATTTPDVTPGTGEGGV